MAPSRSPSPYTRRAQHSSHHREERHRSRSPGSHHENRPRKSDGGFRRKEKPSHDDRDRERDRERDRRDEGRGERGYRERPRQRSPVRDDVATKFGGSAERREKKRDDVDDKFGNRDDGGRKKDKREKKKREEAPAPTGEPMIIVNVNDRLGTKAAIPCLASDPIKLFKAQVAARIGREPHEIMLKRQGERPFKDILTLEDYGVSNGVQLDLEVDTGD